MWRLISPPAGSEALMVSKARPKPRSTRKPTGSASCDMVSLAMFRVNWLDFHVEIPQTVGHRSGIVQVLVGVHIDEAAEIDGADRPYWCGRWGRGWRGCCLIRWRCRWRSLRQGGQRRRQAKRCCADTPIVSNSHEFSIFEMTRRIMGLRARTGMVRKKCGAETIANLFWILASRPDRHKTIIFIDSIENSFPAFIWPRIHCCDLL